MGEKVLSEREQWEQKVTEDCEIAWEVVREFLFLHNPPKSVRLAWDSMVGEVIQLRFHEASLRANQPVTLEALLPHA